MRVGQRVPGGPRGGCGNAAAHGRGSRGGRDHQPGYRGDSEDFLGNRDLTEALFDSDRDSNYASVELAAILERWHPEARWPARDTLRQWARRVVQYGGEDRARPSGRLSDAPRRNSAAAVTQAQARTVVVVAG
jgi:hypothetical protein